MASPPAAAAAVPTYSVTGRVNAYTTPHLPCIHDYGTVNPSKRCIHGCLYCYANASPLAGAKDAIGVFDTLPEMMAAQLKKKGDSAPERMYFSTACDAFQPIPAVQAATRGAFAAILAHPGKVRFL